MTLALRKRPFEFVDFTALFGNFFRSGVPSRNFWKVAFVIFPSFNIWVKRSNCAFDLNGILILTDIKGIALVY